MVPDPQDLVLTRPPAECSLRPDSGAPSKEADCTLPLEAATLQQKVENVPWSWCWGAGRGGPRARQGPRSCSTPACSRPPAAASGPTHPRPPCEYISWLDAHIRQHSLRSKAACIPLLRSAQHHMGLWRTRDKELHHTGAYSLRSRWPAARFDRRT